MRKRSFIRIVTFLLFILILTGLPSSSIAGFAGRFTRIEGKVDLLKAGTSLPMLVKVGDGVSDGDIIRTLINSKAEITFKDETNISLAPETRLKIDEYVFNPNSTRNKGALSLLRGKVRAVVSKTKGSVIPVGTGMSTFNINTPTAVAGVRGTTIFVWYQMGMTGVIFKDGFGFVYNPNRPEQIVNISDGQATFIAGPTDSPTPPRPATDTEIRQITDQTTITGNGDNGGSGTPSGPGSPAGGGAVQAGVSNMMPSQGDEGIYGYSDTEGNLPAGALDISGDNVSYPAENITALLPVTETNPETIYNNTDTTPPVITITGPADLTNIKKAVFNITSDETVTIQYTIDSVSTVSADTASDTLTFDALSEGVHTLIITATDKAGNAATRTYTWTTDYTAPVFSVPSEPLDATNSSSASFDFSSTESAAYFYSLDGAGEVRSDTATITLPQLSDGDHTLNVRATDAAGNSSPVYSRIWTVDTTAPSVSFNDPLSITSSSSVIFELTSNEPVRYFYSLDDGDWSETAPSLSISSITEGGHQLNIKATDNAGNTSPVTQHTFAIDQTLPAVSFSSTPNNITNQTIANFGMSSSEPVTYAYTIDGLTAGSTSLSGLSEGSHTFGVTATDAAGNASTASYTWTTDYTAPEISLTTTTVPVSNSDTADFEFAGNDTTATNSYRLDNGEWTDATSAISLTSTADFSEGLHTIDVKATDNAGNSTIDSFTWFYGTRHYGLEGLASGTGSTLTGALTGDIFAVSNGNQGGWLTELNGSYLGPSSESWQMVSGGRAHDDTEAQTGYWINSAAGSYSGNTMNGTSQFTYLTPDKLAAGTGDFKGYYDAEAGTWTATDAGAGTLIETPLKFMSEVYGDAYSTTINYYGSDTYNDGGGEYYYTYYSDNTYGYQYYYRPGGEHYYTNYNSDGTTDTYDYNTSTVTYGTWDTSQPLSFLSNPIDPDNIISSYNDNWPELQFTGEINGIIGGTTSLWNGSDIPVTFIGESSMFTGIPQIWFSYINSFNNSTSTNTTYDGGAYYGFMSGIDTGSNNSLEGDLYALYISPDGHAGYLKSRLNGTSYPDISMFEMEGDISRTEVTTDTGITAEHLNESIWIGEGYGEISGLFGGSSGSITGYIDSFETFSIADFHNENSQQWGIFYQAMAGQFLNPAADWSAKMGGYGVFGARDSLIMTYHYASFYYPDGGEYYYTYYSDNTSGSLYYYRPGGEDYYTDYYSDGTTYTYDYNTSTGTYGTWDTANMDLSSIATPPDLANAVLNYSSIFNDEDGYWLADISGGKWDGDKLSGNINGRFMTPYRIGELTGNVLGTYNTNDGQWQATAGGVYTSGTPLSFSGTFGDEDTPFYSVNQYGILNESLWVGGLLGGTTSPWSGETSVVFMGEYSGPSYDDLGPFIWTPVISSWNPDNSTYSTYDGGTFWGFIGGVMKDRDINGNLLSLYIDPDGNAGILKGNVTGAYYPSDEHYYYYYDSMFEADGLWSPIQMETGMPVSPIANLNANWYWHFNAFSAGGFSAGGTIFGVDIDEMGYAIDGQNWGIWEAITGGTYSGSTSDMWVYYMDGAGDYGYTGILNGSQTTGVQWSNERLSGSTVGYGGNVTTASTWISVGDTIGTFDPNAMTWQAVQTGLYLSTDRFLAMTQTVEGQAKLQQLNIPFAEVGMVNLSGTGNNMAVNMNDVKFFAYSNGDAPKIWASGDVSGNYTASPVINTAVALSGGGLTADFNIQQWDTVNNKWLSSVTNGTGSITGGGTNVQNLNFSGAAAGTISPSAGTFSGTGAGITHIQISNAD